MSENVSKKLSKVIKIDETQIQKHLDHLVRGSVEDAINNFLDAEADQFCNAARYERTQARKDTRAGHYKRKLHTKAGELTVKVPKLRQQKFQTAIIGPLLPTCLNGIDTVFSPTAIFLKNN